MLDPTGQRIVGVLLEKELSVPDSYPMTENALLAGCNQKSNRDPQMALEEFQMRGALMALREREWIAKVEGGGRVPKYKHQVEQRLGLGAGERAVLAELLLRGPQAPGALKARVARMGLKADTEQVREILEGLAQRSPPVVEHLPRQPREREARWAHRLGQGGDATNPEGEPDDESGRQEDQPSPAGDAVGVSKPVTELTAPRSADAPSSTGLESRVMALEHAVAQLRAEIRALRSAPQVEQD